MDKFVESVNRNAQVVFFQGLLAIFSNGLINQFYIEVAWKVSYDERQPRIPRKTMGA
ncbi:hypothetical protein AGMMS50233_06790 [Endomicrobiia bacterium]|nr:hypothetical protein AGMMS50233_06790 [Endomicrobiia bacterium]